MKKYILRYALTFFNGKLYAGNIEFPAVNLEAAQANGFEQLYQFLKEKAIDKGDHELDYLENLKQLVLKVEESK